LEKFRGGVALATENSEGGMAKEISRGEVAMEDKEDTRGHKVAMEDLLAQACGSAATIFKTGVNMYNRLKSMNDSESQSDQLASNQMGSNMISNTSSKVFLQVHF